MIESGFGSETLLKDLIINVFAGRLHAVHDHQAENTVLDAAQALTSFSPVLTL
jgi:hypothetical protein